MISKQRVQVGVNRNWSNRFYSWYLTANKRFRIQCELICIWGVRWLCTLTLMNEDEPPKQVLTRVNAVRFALRGCALQETSSRHNHTSNAKSLTNPPYHCYIRLSASQESCTSNDKYRCRLSNTRTPRLATHESPTTAIAATARIAILTASVSATLPI